MSESATDPIIAEAYEQPLRREIARRMQVPQLLAATSLLANKRYRRRFATPADAFRWKRIPGLEMVTPEDEETPTVPRLRPLLNRCACGKVISNNALTCRNCAVAEIQQTARLITTPEALELFLADFSEQERPELLKALQPYLKLEPVVEASLSLKR